MHRLPMGPVLAEQPPNNSWHNIVKDYDAEWRSLILDNGVPHSFFSIDRT